MYNVLLNELKNIKRKELQNIYERNLRTIEDIYYNSIEELILHNPFLLNNYPEFNFIYIKKFIKYHSIENELFGENPIIYVNDEKFDYSETLLDEIVLDKNILFSIDSDEYGDTISILNTNIKIFIPSATD